MRPKAAIIGSGIAGIAVAIRLVRMGYDVDLYEKNNYTGGKIYEFRNDGFRFDTGPSLFTLPELVDELFTLCGENASLCFNYQKLENTCRYFFEDGTVLNAWSDINRFAEEISEKLGEDPKNLFRYLKESEKLYDICSKVFIFSPFQHLTRLLKIENLPLILRLFHFDAHKSLHERNRTSFQSPDLIQIFDHFAVHVGSNPYQVPAMLKIIPSIEYNHGTYYPENGMYSIVKTLTELAQRHGVHLHLNSPVEKVLTRDDHISGIRVHGEELAYDVVVNDTDIYSFYKQLLIEYPIPESINHPRRSSSAIVFYWGIDDQFAETDIHNYFFAKSYKEEFDCIFDQKTISDDPSIYLYVSSKRLSSDAPLGCENWFVMVNAPSNYGQDWVNLINRTREAVIHKLNRILKTDIQPHIRFEKVIDPKDIEETTGSWQGSIYGNSSDSAYTTFYRHPNFHRRISNLYFTGGSVHPGGGIPLCLASAKIVANEILREWTS